MLPEVSLELLKKRLAKRTQSLGPNELAGESSGACEEEAHQDEHSFKKTELALDMGRRRYNS